MTDAYTFVIPGRSTRVRFSTLGLYMRRLMGELLMPLFVPERRSVVQSVVCMRTEYVYM